MKTTIVTTLLATALAAAAGGPGRDCPPDTAKSAAFPNKSTAPDYILHEWGTFTTLSASNGTQLPGVQIEEEPLPEFVLNHAGMEHPQWMRAVKGWRRPLAGVTVRMETPVIYFYTKDAFDVHVDVGFKGGSISQWYPERSGGEIPPPIKVNEKGWPLGVENTLDFAKGYNGRIQWDVRVEPAGADIAGRVFKPRETPSWIYPRLTDSALVTNKDGQAEKYLFYRGLGNFNLPITLSSTGPGTVTIKNPGAHHCAGMLIYERNDDGFARWEHVEGVPAGETRTFSLSSKRFNPVWQNDLYADGVALLTKAGLYRKEADAMLQTWWPSYFERTGLRVFWIVPRPFTDSILPLTVSPAPKETVRVLVGRSEVMTPEFEQQLLADFREAADKDRTNRWQSDRYFPAYTERVKQLGQTTALAK
jgi:hypothetical protein